MRSLGTKCSRMNHIPSNFLKAAFHKFYLVRSWILCLIVISMRVFLVSLFSLLMFFIDTFSRTAFISWVFMDVITTEAVVRGWKTWGLQLYEKKTLTQVFFCEFYEIFQNTFFIEHFRRALLLTVHLFTAVQILRTNEEFRWQRILN